MGQRVIFVIALYAFAAFVAGASLSAFLESPRTDILDIPRLVLFLMGPFVGLANVHLFPLFVVPTLIVLPLLATAAVKHGAMRKVLLAVAALVWFGVGMLGAAG